MLTKAGLVLRLLRTMDGLVERNRKLEDEVKWLQRELIIRELEHEREMAAKG
jgi:hypothetical protein